CIEMALDSGMSLAQGPPDLRAVPDTARGVCRHGPESAHRSRGHLHAELSQIAFEESANEIFPPGGARSIRARQKRPRKTATQPQAIEFRAVKLLERETAHLDDRDPARQSFGALPQQLRRGAAQDEKSRPNRLAIQQHPENRKKIGMTLHLIDHDQPS